MIGLSLSELAEVMAGRLISSQPASTLVAGSVETDSRLVGVDSLFFAKPGEVTDGHRFVPQAAAAGAAAVVVDHAVETEVSQIVVDDVVGALGALAQHVVRTVAEHGRLKVIGVTGSNGKTTTKTMLRSVFEQVGPTIAPVKSFNNEVGAPMTMLRLTDQTEFLIAEMGASHRGDIARLVRMAPPDVGVVLMVGLAHAGEFGSIEATAEAKSEMVADLAPDAWAVLNRDDPRVEAMADKTRAEVLWFGHDQRSDLVATDIMLTPAGTEFTLSWPQRGEIAAGDARVHLRILGEHHVNNALAAASAAFVLGVDPARIVSGLESVELAERWRMQVLGGRATIINDAYNASPDSMSAALRTLAQLGGGTRRTVAVLGEMTELGDRSGEEHDRTALQVVRLGIDQLVVVGEGARRLHISAINEGSWDGESVFAETTAEAFDTLTALIRDDDIVLVKSSNSAGLWQLGDRLGEEYAW